MNTASVNGLSGLSIGDLAAQLDMSKSGLFRHFGAKEQLQMATVDAALEVFAREVIAPAMMAEAGLARLRELMRNWIGYLESNVFPGGCFFIAASADVDSRPGPVRDRIAEIGRSAINAIASEVEQAIDLGELRADTDAHQLAFELHAYALETNWARQLLDDDAAGDLARRAIDSALARAGTTEKGDTP